MDATEQREAALAKIEEQVAAAAADRVAAESERRSTEQLAVQTVQHADDRAAQILIDATTQTDIIKESARVFVRQAEDKVTAAEEEARHRLHGIADREDACAIREAKVEEEAEQVLVENQRIKLLRDEYEALIGNIRALASKAPK